MILNHEEIQLIAIEIRLATEKWAFICIYRPPTQSLPFFLEKLSETLDMIYVNYVNILIVGDFNINSTGLNNFLENHQLVSLLDIPTCFKSLSGTCIDLIITNSKRKILDCSAIETGMSDHHLMIYGFFKSNFTKLPPKKILYRDYKDFSIEQFNSELLSTTLRAENLDYETFENIFMEILNILAPFKTKILRGNHKPHVDHILRKEIMKRSRLKHVANTTKSFLDISAYKKQRNFVAKLNTEQKKRYFESTISSPGKSLWDVCKPYLGKTKSEEVIQILHEGSVFSDEKKVANLFNDYFCNIYNSLNIQYWEPDIAHYMQINDPVDKCIAKFDFHPSILKIRSNFKPNIFQFRKVTVTDVWNYVMKLDSKKKTSGGIPTNILQNEMK